MQWGTTVIKIWIGCSLAVLVLFLLWRLPRLLCRNSKGSFGRRVVRLFGGAVFVFLLASCIWPVGLVMLIREVWETISIRLAPKWAVSAEGDITEQTWAAADGREFSASVVGLSHRDKQNVSAEWPHDGAVCFRYRRLAPEQTAASEWQGMARMSVEDWAQMIEEERELHEPRPYDADLRMERGRYLIEFRVEIFPGQFQEFTGLTLIAT